MIAKVFRFHGHGSLRFLYTKGTTVRTNFMSLRYIKNQRRQSGRLAVVVAKKVSKKAPVRNRIRRRIYEVMRQHWSMIEPGHDMVITIFDDRLATIPAEEVGQLVQELLNKVKIYKM